MSLRRLLIRLLLLAVCFHAVIGLSAHDAAHIRQRIAPPAALAFDASAVFLANVEADIGEGMDTGAGGHGGSAVDALCAWCVAFAQIASALASPPPPPSLAAADAAGLSFPRLHAVFIPRPDRWCFASRDPPRALPDRPSSPTS